MNYITNLFLEVANFETSQSTPTPLVKLARWRYKQFSWAAYQLPNGELVMSERQISLTTGQPKKYAKAFFELNRLTSIAVQLPNRKTIVVYPLSTSVVTYCQHLLNNNQIPQRFSQIEWENIIESLKHPEEQTSSQLSLPEATHKDEKTPVLAKAIVLKTQDGLQLEVLILPDKEYRISFWAGLTIIGLFPNWLIQLPNCANKLERLKKRGYSGLSKQCSIQTPEGSKIVESLSLDDWLTIWEFFACRGNGKAAAILKACAKENIPQQIETPTKPYSIQERRLRSKAMA